VAAVELASFAVGEAVNIDGAGEKAFEGAHLSKATAAETSKLLVETEIKPLCKW
jgi:hypothetical protein